MPNEPSDTIILQAWPSDDAAKIVEWRESLMAAADVKLGQHGNIYLDAKNVVSFESELVGSLISLQMKAKALSKRVVILNANPFWKSVFSVTHLDRVFVLRFTD